jgi:murein tripeptide amidase MpaA
MSPTPLAKLPTNAGRHGRSSTGCAMQRWFTKNLLSRATQSGVAAQTKLISRALWDRFVRGDMSVRALSTASRAFSSVFGMRCV